MGSARTQYYKCVLSCFKGSPRRWADTSPIQKQTFPVPAISILSTFGIGWANSQGTWTSDQIRHNGPKDRPFPLSLLYFPSRPLIGIKGVEFLGWYFPLNYSDCFSSQVAQDLNYLWLAHTLYPCTKVTLPSAAVSCSHLKSQHLSNTEQFCSSAQQPAVRILEPVMSPPSPAPK